jgi:hypothetical protein
MTPKVKQRNLERKSPKTNPLARKLNLFHQSALAFAKAIRVFGDNLV